MAVHETTNGTDILYRRLPAGPVFGTRPMTPVIRSRGYLPHIESDMPVYFVTFRLADSLPQALLAQMRQERERLDRGKLAGTTGARMQPDDDNCGRFCEKPSDFSTADSANATCGTLALPGS